MTKTYTPRSDSLAAQVIGYLTNNAGAELTLDGIIEQFDCTRGNIHTLLLPAREAGLLKRDKNEDGEYIYILASSASAPARKARVAKTESSSGVDIDACFRKPRMLFKIEDLPDPNTVQIDDGIPLQTITGRPKTQWPILLARLKPGQSCQLPIAAKHSLATAVSEAHKNKKHGRFTLRTNKAEATLRVWRTA